MLFHPALHTKSGVMASGISVEQVDRICMEIRMLESTHNSMKL